MTKKNTAAAAAFQVLLLCSAAMAAGAPGLRQNPQVFLYETAADIAAGRTKFAVSESAANWATKDGAGNLVPEAVPPHDGADYVSAIAADKYLWVDHVSKKTFKGSSLTIGTEESPGAVWVGNWYGDMVFSNLVLHSGAVVLETTIGGVNMNVGPGLYSHNGDTIKVETGREAPFRILCAGYGSYFMGNLEGDENASILVGAEPGMVTPGRAAWVQMFQAGKHPDYLGQWVFDGGGKEGIEFWLNDGGLGPTPTNLVAKAVVLRNGAALSARKNIVGDMAVSFPNREFYIEASGARYLNRTYPFPSPTRYSVNITDTVFAGEGGLRFCSGKFSLGSGVAFRAAELIVDTNSTVSAGLADTAATAIVLDGPGGVFQATNQFFSAEAGRSFELRGGGTLLGTSSSYNAAAQAFHGDGILLENATFREGGLTVTIAGAAGVADAWTLGSGCSVEPGGRITLLTRAAAGQSFPLAGDAPRKIEVLRIPAAAGIRDLDEGDFDVSGVPFQLTPTTTGPDPENIWVVRPRVERDADGTQHVYLMRSYRKRGTVFSLK